jgi:phosphosulfolactate synthase (CoM biosynthesis protein A)
MGRVELAVSRENGQLAKNKGNEQQNAEKVMRVRKILDKGKERVIFERPE